ncbi:MAG: GFA family protein [Pseudomonadota bacterium]
METFEGGCQCGAVRYVAAIKQLVGYACHCLECQKQSASAFGLSVTIPSRQFTIKGKMDVYRRSTDLGGVTACWFCTACGTRLYHQSEGGNDYVTIKGGSLDRSDLLDPAAHIWTKRKQRWVLLPPEKPAHETQPDNLHAWRQLLSLSDEQEVPR